MLMCPEHLWDSAFPPQRVRPSVQLMFETHALAVATDKGVGSEEVQMVKSQLQDTLRIKQDREQEIINVMGRCAELEAGM
jgi:hypothetical protein